MQAGTHLELEELHEVLQVELKGVISHGGFDHGANLVWRMKSICLVANNKAATSSAKIKHGNFKVYIERR